MKPRVLLHNPFSVVLAVIGWVASVCTVCSLPSPATASMKVGDGTTYHVRVPDPEPTYVEIEADMELASNRVGMVISESSLANGQADLVRDLKVLNAAGLPIEFTGPESGDWTLSGVEVGQRVTVRYRILLEHEMHKWPAGIDEVAYVREDGLFFTGFSLFIVSALEGEGAISVTFDLPDGWHASTPWSRSPSDGETHKTETTSGLLRNCLYLGTHKEETVRIGEFTFVMAIGGRLRDSSNLFAETMRPLIPSYIKTFGGLPNNTRYLVVLHEDAKGDGGAFLESYSMLLAGEVNEASRAIWGHGIAHELLHFWNGHTIRPSTQEEWFKEGFTDYLTITSMHNTGLIDDAMLYKKLENIARRYTLAKRLMAGGSMREAGAEKHRQYFLVYGGGAAAGFTLDVRIRAASDNRRGLTDLLKIMYEEFGTTGKGYTLDDIIRIASTVSGKDQSPFFEKYVVGEEMLPLAEAFETLGLQFDAMMDECYVSSRDEATPAQLAMQRSMFGPRVESD